MLSLLSIFECTLCVQSASQAVILTTSTFCQKHFILRLGYFFLSLQNINLETSEMQKCDGDDKSFDRSFGSSAQFVVHFLSDLTWDIIGFSQHPLRYYDIFIAILIFIFRLFGVLFNDYYHWSSHTRIWIGKGVFFIAFIFGKIVCKFIKVITGALAINERVFEFQVRKCERERVCDFNFGSDHFQITRYWFGFFTNSAQQ